MTQEAILTRDGFDAAIFDFDGVVADTASLHAQAWKSVFDTLLSMDKKDGGEKLGHVLSPFDPGEDYRLFVEGKPRIDGVRDFLRSRNILLPEGRDADPPGLKTLYGLGNWKNRIFQKYLQDEGVKIADSLAVLLQELKRHGFRCAVISASRNCTAILEMVGLAERFDAKVDGLDTERLGIPGKPNPGIFLEAAERLAAEPRRCVVIEDSLTGVEAAKSGGFGLVVGLAAGEKQAGLLGRGGADIVIADLSELSVVGSAPLPLRETGTGRMPSALDSREAILAEARGRRFALFLDYDGTLTPIVDAPDRALLSPGARRLITRLAKICPVAVVSGRDLRDIRRLVGVNSLMYAGSHGFEISGPGGVRSENEAAEDYLPDLDGAEGELRAELRGVRGFLVERKRFSIAVHYRLVAEEDAAAVEKAVNGVAAGHPRLRKTYGKKVFELQPDLEWNKGEAVLSLLRELGLDGGGVLPLFIGDDVTDEDAFRALRGRGVTVAVQEQARPTEARYTLHNPGEVLEFLGMILEIAKGGVPHV
jgi:alpha,alpha-trehalase